MSEAELRRLAYPEYWDERYNEVGPEKQVHEWFRSFDELVPFLNRHLFQEHGPETAPMILHLGSGDSVSLFDPKSFMRLRQFSSIADDSRRSFEKEL